MAGAITLLQGPLGVLSSAPARPSKPRQRGIARITGSATAGLDLRASRDDAPDVPYIHKDDADQCASVPVSASTLFDASRIAAELPPPSPEQKALASQMRERWSPPQSSLSLRDRTI
ncbi:hypothetical protein GCM10011499_16820 [Pelagibacterium lentulum]|uniref:Uncharacterized protein n=1 Tax=Pelagibacterium lentulum TaxID=2029865 RepID=A0A916RD32_9HYPH|nr:hypothetical protein GCM10011499_16820 [Pelagibacterium lentulum]